MNSRVLLFALMFLFVLSSNSLAQAPSAADVNALKIEIEALKSYIERHHPDFAESYPKLKKEAIQAIDPEWLAAVEEPKQ